MPHAGKIARKAHEPTSSSGVENVRAASRRDRRFECGKRALTVGLTERHEQHAGSLLFRIFGTPLG